MISSVFPFTFHSVLLTLAATSNASSSPKAASESWRFHMRTPLVNVEITMHVNDTTATTPPRSSGVFRYGGGSRPAISWNGCSGRLEWRVRKDSAFFRSAIVRALHRTKAQANEGSTLQDCSFLGELISQASGHEMTRKAFLPSDRGYISSRNQSASSSSMLRISVLDSCTINVLPSLQEYTTSRSFRTGI